MSLLAAAVATFTKPNYLSPINAIFSSLTCVTPSPAHIVQVAVAPSSF